MKAFAISTFLLFLSFGVSGQYADYPVGPGSVDQFVSDFFSHYGDHPGVGVSQNDLKTYLNNQFPPSPPSELSCDEADDFFVISNEDDAMTLGWSVGPHADAIQVSAYALSNGVSTSNTEPGSATSSTLTGLNSGLYLLALQVHCSLAPRSTLLIIIVDRPIQLVTPEYYNNCTCDYNDVILDVSSDEVTNMSAPVTANWLSQPLTEQIYYVNSHFKINNSQWTSDYYMKITFNAFGEAINYVNISNPCTNNIAQTSHVQFLFSKPPPPFNVGFNPAYFTFSQEFTFHPNEFPASPANEWSVEVRRCEAVNIPNPNDPGGDFGTGNNNSNSGGGTGGDTPNNDRSEQASNASTTVQLQAMPNPSTDRTVLNYSLPGESEVTLSLYNELGMAVRVISKRVATAGDHSVIFNWNDLPTGIYTCQLQSAFGQEVIRLVRKQ